MVAKRLKHLKKNVQEKKRNYREIKKNSLFTLFLYFIISCFFLSAIFIMIAIFYASRDLPSIESIKNYKSSLTTRLYSSDGVLLNNYAAENRIFIPIDEVPEIIKQAFLSAEDYNFYDHAGIDVMGMLKASYKNAIFFITGQGQLVGASTITQQVVKNILLTNEKTLTRKFKEVILSLELTKSMSKDEVFEIYLNHIYLGSSAYGVMAASYEYFGKSVKDITPAEAALLAALPKAPSDINPRRRKERAVERRNWVLQRMAENGFISRGESVVLKASPLGVVSQKKVHKVSNGVNSFTDNIKTIVSGIYGSDAFFSSGYYVKTTLDYKVQTALYKAFRTAVLNYDTQNGYRGDAGFITLSQDNCGKLGQFVDNAVLTDFILKYALVLSSNTEEIKAIDENCSEVIIPTSTLNWAKKRSSDYSKGGQIIVFNSESNAFSQMPEINGGAIVINPKNGDVLAMIGDFFDRPNGFNRSLFAKRQLGSAIKPFVYITALENGFAPNSILIDEDLKLSDEWQPRNASRDFLGSITLRTALERSRNIPTVRISEMLGGQLIVNRFAEFGLNAEPLENDLSTALGTFSVTVDRVARAFSVFVNSGRKPELSFINKISDSDGKLIFSKDGECDKSCFDEAVVPIVKNITYGEKVAEEEVAFQILSILEGAAQRGTAHTMMQVSPFGIAGKTGTTSDYKDAWFAGITNDLSAVVYLGNDKPKTLGEGQYGAVLALPIIRELFAELKTSYPITPFVPPNSLEQIAIDYNTGQLPTSSSSRKIIEYFKEKDKRPKKLVFEMDTLTQVENEELEDKINNGIY